MGDKSPKNTQKKTTQKVAARSAKSTPPAAAVKK